MAQIQDIEASTKPCSKCKHVWPAQEFPEGSIQRIDYARCAKEGCFCTTARGSLGDCGKKAKFWDPVNEEDRPMASYDPDTHDAIPLPLCFVGLGGVVFTGIVILVWLLGALFGSSTTESPAEARWRTKYYELACKSRGLVLNVQSTYIVCMDPKSKAMYEIE
jgi:hypothetical protein